MSEKDQVPDSKKTMMDYEETFKFDKEWKASRCAAEEMMRDIQGLKEEFILDQITLGDGQCFMTAIIQQMRRPDVNSSLSQDLQKFAWMMDPRAFKFKVRKFMKDSPHPKVQDLRKDFQIFTGLPWEEFWSARHIMKRDTWADHVFIQSSAWYLQKDIVIHQNITSQPIQIISGNIDDENEPCRDPKLHVGYLFRRHYQSVIPRVSKVKENLFFGDNEGRSKNAQTKKANIAQVQIKDSLSCPVCKKSLKNILLHLKKNEIWIMNKYLNRNESHRQFLLAERRTLPFFFFLASLAFLKCMEFFKGDIHSTEST